ncbi:hypothetical protein [Kitasatospora griseola]
MTDDHTQPAPESTDTDPASEGNADLATEVHFPPVANGLDYLLSVVEQLSNYGEITPRQLKYAVVHLQAAAECLLKHRLELEHWSLVFKNPGDAKRSELDDGTLSTCTVDQTISRLTNIAGVTINDREAKGLRQVASLRNALQHYTRLHDPSSKVNRYQIEANAVEVLEFLIHFLEQELLPRFSQPERDTATADMMPIRHGLGQIRGYVQARMGRIWPRLADVRHCTLQCPSCHELALVVKDGTVGCLFCQNAWSPYYGAEVYAAVVLGRGPWSDSHDGPKPVVCCPNCGIQALVLGAVTADDRDIRVDLCFSCSEITTHPEPCERCGEPFLPNDHETACADCLDILTGTDR